MKKYILLTMTVFISVSVLYLGGCTGAKEEEKKEETEVKESPKDTIQKPVLEYKIIYKKQDGIFYFNTKDSTEKLLQKTGDVTDIKVINSPEGNSNIFVLTEKNGNRKFYSYSENSGKMQLIKTLAKNYYYNIFWKSDSLIYYNYYEKKKGTYDKNLTLFIGYTEILDIVKNKTTGTIKLQKGDVLHSNIQNKQLIFSDESNFYIYDIKSGRVKKEIPGLMSAERSSLTFSPDGSKYFFTEIKKRKDPSGNIYTYNELYTGDILDKEPKLSLDFNYDAQNLSWSPDSRYILCSVVSQNFGNIRSVCLYDIIDEKAIIKGEENPEKMRKISRCIFSPAGNILAMQYISEGITSAGEMLTVQDMNTGKEDDLPLNGETIESWLTDELLLLIKGNENIIFSIKNKSAYSFDKGRVLIVF